MGESWSVLKVLRWTAGYLGEKGVDGARLDAELLLCDLLGLDRVGLYLNYDRPLEASELAAFRERVGRRARREPLQYILGETEFWSLTFRVSPAVLIPRADTEVLVEEALARVKDPVQILDVGTGSGAIAVALAHDLPASGVKALDISPEALAIAGENARLNGVQDRVECVQGDLYQLPAGPYGLIVSNPPYIPARDIEGLMPEVRDFEPRSALDGGDDGLNCYRALAHQAPALLLAGGWFLCEVGQGQAADVEELLRQQGFEEVFNRADYAGIPRVVGGRSPSHLSFVP